MCELSPRYVSILACGLRGDSRIYRAISGNEYSMDTRLNAMMVDNLSWLVWSKTKDAEHGRNKPVSIYKKLFDEECEQTTSFDSAEAFERARAEILRRNTNG